MARWALVMNGGNYYRFMTAIGPCYGGTPETAKVFATKREAEAERYRHLYGFATAKAVRLPTRRARREAAA